MSDHAMFRTGESERSSGRSERLGVTALAFGVFVVGTGEFVLAGLLPLLSRSLEVSITAAGQVITVFALTCAVAGPVLTALTASWPRRVVLLAAILVYLAGAVGTALASSYLQALLAQIVAATGVGLYVPNASVTAAALVPPERRGRAIAMVVAGFTAAVALGAPFGAALGGLTDWRTTMWLIAGLGVLGLFGVLFFVPRATAAEPVIELRRRLRPLADRQVLTVLGVTLVGFTAIYIPYTYIGAVFRPAIGDGGVRLAALMLALGVIGTVGNLAAGVLADRVGGPKVVAVALIWVTISMLIIPLANESLSGSFAVIAFYGVAAFAITTPQQHRLISLKPDSSAILISLNQAILYLAIASSGLLGGVGIVWFGAKYVSLLAAAFALVALGLSELERRRAFDSLASGAADSARRIGDND